MSQRSAREGREPQERRRTRFLTFVKVFFIGFGLLVGGGVVAQSYRTQGGDGAWVGVALAALTVPWGVRLVVDDLKRSGRPVRREDAPAAIVISESGWALVAPLVTRTPAAALLVWVAVSQPLAAVLALPLATVLLLPLARVLTGRRRPGELRVTASGLQWSIDRRSHELRWEEIARIDTASAPAPPSHRRLDMLIGLIDFMNPLTPNPRARVRIALKQVEASPSAGRAGVRDADIVIDPEPLGYDDFVLSDLLRGPVRRPSARASTVSDRRLEEFRSRQCVLRWW